MGRIKAAGEQKKENENKKLPLLKRYQRIMMAATFAEAGEPETAKAFMGNANKSSEDKGEENGQG
jgi:hypothetical protein